MIFRPRVKRLLALSAILVSFAGYAAAADDMDWLFRQLEEQDQERAIEQHRRRLDDLSREQAGQSRPTIIFQKATTLSLSHPGDWDGGDDDRDDGDGNDRFGDSMV